MTDDDSPVEITHRLRSKLGDAAEDVQEEYRDFYNWMLEKGKNPKRYIALSDSSAENYIRRLDQLHRFTIEYLDPEDPTVIEDDHADELLHMIDRGEVTKQRGKHEGEEYNESAKRKFSNTIEKYFEWRYHERSMEYTWQPRIGFSDGRTNSAYEFTYRELGLLFEAAESYGSLPNYYETTGEDRDRINGLVAERLGIPKADVTRSDWLRADWSSKVHSMVQVGYDAGLAPKEMRRARVDWYSPQTQTLRIPTEHACKEREKEEVGLSDAAAEALSRWFKQQRHLEKYDGTTRIWLNREGNPYQSGSLCNLIRNLYEAAGLETEGRKIVWYSLRKTMGSKVTDEGELSEANDQLRHNHIETTQGSYNKTPTEKLQARLNGNRKKARKAAADPDYNPYEDEQQSDHDTTNDRPHSQSPRNRDRSDAIRQTESGIYADVEIPDTREARVDIARQLLDDDGDD